MVEQVTSWRAEDGQLFPTRLAAVRHDAKQQMLKSRLFNEAIINTMLDKASAIVELLAPIAEAQNKEKRND